MNSVILDSSVILAYLNNETISSEAIDLFQYSVVSAVTYSEVLGILLTRNLLSKAKASEILSSLIDRLVSFDEKQAEIAAEIDILNKQNKFGLSLADRACLALGIHLKLPIYTADQIWAKVNLPGVKIKLIR